MVLELSSNELFREQITPELLLKTTEKDKRIPNAFGESSMTTIPET